MFLIVFLIVVGYKIYPVSQPNSSSGDSSVGESQGTESQEGTTELWQPERVRVKLIDQMKGSLGLHRPELNISKLHDAEILERFVSLFYVDRDELGLTPTETEQMKIRGKNPLTHPMIEFLNQFKSPPQEVKINKDESRGKQCVTSMIRLQDSFIELLEDDFIELLDPDFIKLLEDDDFQHHTPHEVVQLFRFQLDYEKFYHRWYVKYDQSGPEKPYLDDEGKGLTDSWVVKVRKYLKKRFRAS